MVRQSCSTWHLGEWGWELAHSSPEISLSLCSPTHPIRRLGCMPRSWHQHDCGLGHKGSVISQIEAAEEHPWNVKSPNKIRRWKWSWTWSFNSSSRKSTTSETHCADFVFGGFPSGSCRWRSWASWISWGWREQGVGSPGHLHPDGHCCDLGWKNFLDVVCQDLFWKGIPRSFGGEQRDGGWWWGAGELFSRWSSSTP